MNDRDLATDEPIKESRLPDIRTSDDRDARQFCLSVHRESRSRLIPRRVRVSRGLELAHAVHHINHAGDERENSRDGDNEKERKKM